jgi:uncharacterized protein (TIGR02284 family)
MLAPIQERAMRRFLTIAVAIAALASCAQMETDARPDAGAMGRLGSNAEITAETDKLNHLTRVAIDANRLYDGAADEADDKELQVTLRTISSGRKMFAQKLQHRVAALGAQPAQTGQATGAVHRSFTALRGLIENDSVAAADEVYRGESYIIDELGKSLETKLTSVSRDMVSAELQRAKASRNQVEQLKTRIEARLMNEAAREDAAARLAQPSPG